MVAPLATASFTRSSTSFTAAGVMSGPMTVRGSCGSPERRVLVRATNFSRNSPAILRCTMMRRVFRQNLALVEERAEGCGAHRIIHVDVVENDHGIVATQFH